MELDLHEPIKKALSRARQASESGDSSRAAAAYDKAASLMALYAEQATGREAEERRKRKAIEYREMARKLRSGEVAEPVAAAPAGNGAEPVREAAPAGAAPELRSIGSNLMTNASGTWNDHRVV